MEGCELIRKTIESYSSVQDGVLIGRFGTIEFDVLYAKWNGNAITKDMLSILERNAGVFGSINDINRWSNEYADAAKEADIMATGWYEPIKVREQRLLNSMEFAGKQVALRSLEPYYWDESVRWSRVLKGKVCVVSSFADTIMKQLSKDHSQCGVWSKIHGKMWGEDVEWSAVRTGYAPSLALGRASWECASSVSVDPSSWSDSVDYVVEEVLRTGARTVIIGCGGLGMIIGARLKAAGKICIVLGGATQVLFGIKGRRWETHVISKLWGADWVWPAIHETPGGASDVERGCYWG
jgi:hypothetical protein